MNSSLTCINEPICRVMHEFLDKIIGSKYCCIFFDCTLDYLYATIGIVALVRLHF